MAPISTDQSRPTRPISKFPKPLLRLEIRDLSHPAAHVFVTQLDISKVLEQTVRDVLNRLYTADSKIPHVRSVTLVLRPMDGVAYTTGLEIDDQHKEIHFSLDYINNVDRARQREEICGVLCHEMVHCWQNDACGTSPGGLTEGVADWVRLRCGLSPPHWKRESDGDWDAGYQHTGYFLDYLEERFGEGTVRSINEELREVRYEEERFWKGLFKCSVETLWSEYGESLKEVGGEKNGAKEGNERNRDDSPKMVDGFGDPNMKMEIRKKEDQ
ncbi:hypothetical protein LTR66_004608 [Elasticomyces elasticus]|nr:hypothetical protein LTR50_002166 [Elasticomyces elasticus]KAK4995605.1 hypothetical protein LTR66_004608 [Elasticomyces elasticus]